MRSRISPSLQMPTSKGGPSDCTTNRVLLCTRSELRRDITAGRHSVSSFAKEVQSICEAAIIRLYPIDKAAASRVLGALDMANRMLMESSGAQQQHQQQQPTKQYAPINDRGLWLPPAEAQRYLQPPPAQWQQPQHLQQQQLPPTPPWVQQLPPEQLHAAAAQYAVAHQYAQQLAAQAGGQSAGAALQNPVHLQQFLQQQYQEQQYQQLQGQQQQQQQATPQQDMPWWAGGSAQGQSPTEGPVRRIVRRAPASAPAAGVKRKGASSSGGSAVGSAGRPANGSGRSSAGKAAKKPKVGEGLW